MSYGVGHRRGLDPTLLWLWYRPTAAAPTRPLAWEPPYAVALKRQKGKKKNQIYFFIMHIDYGPKGCLSESWQRLPIQSLLAVARESATIPCPG